MASLVFRLVFVVPSVFLSTFLDRPALRELPGIDKNTPETDLDGYKLTLTRSREL